jgi:hypothetical protein
MMLTVSDIMMERKHRQSVLENVKYQQSRATAGPDSEEPPFPAQHHDPECFGATMRRLAQAITQAAPPPPASGRELAEAFRGFCPAPARLLPGGVAGEQLFQGGSTGLNPIGGTCVFPGQGQYPALRLSLSRSFVRGLSVGTDVIR